ncbi:sodium- and chloride-dependent betaine transporter-like [Megalops cyprinoides]|uniref:sodium- and chloride-dependent betaine transporter-like n=1 Tax=Megalops cyprinoides TaxID=118141 RepID=UPI00186414F8|nr:sodium- and chloride-dependent betaine transporter-like [Megalops cyprinoides]
MKERGKWTNKTEFLLAMAGQMIGMGNIWGFPNLCFKNGGGAFFIPYFVFLFSCGIPLFFMEMALGQYTCEGGVTAWRKICPLFEGIGVAWQIRVVYLNVYSIVVLAWPLFYLWNCFTRPFPWSSCHNNWNTDVCHNQTSGRADWSFLFNNTDYDDMDSNRVLIWSGKDVSLYLGNMQWELAMCLLLAGVVCYFCVWKGVKYIGKVVYFTTTFPFLLLFILFVRGLSLPGAWEGVKYYLYPDFSKIAYLHVWFDAATQVLFSHGLCRGVLTAIGSYNRYSNNCYKDCLLLCILNAVTCVFAGFVVFSVLGFLAHEQNMPVDEISVSGWTGQAFVIYLRAVSLLPGARFWTLLFLIMMFFLGLGTQFLCMESLVTAITDVFPHMLRRRGRHEILVLITGVACFLLALPLVTEAGGEIFFLIEVFGASGTNLLFIACLETVIIGWVYGADRFYDNIEDMIGYRPFPVIKYCWLFLTPIICALILAYGLVDIWMYMGLFTLLGHAFAGLLALGPVVCIIVFALVALCEKPDGIITPSRDLRQACPSRPRLALCGRVIIAGQKPAHGKAKEEKLAMEPAGAV